MFPCLYCNQIMIHDLILLGEDGEPIPLLVEGEVKKQRKRQARKKSQLENSFPNYLQVLLHFYILIANLYGIRTHLLVYLLIFILIPTCILYFCAYFSFLLIVLCIDVVGSFLWKRYPWQKQGQGQTRSPSRLGLRYRIQGLYPKPAQGHPPAFAVPWTKPGQH